MRFKHHNFGDTRVREFFAWFPVWDENVNETRWLERVKVLERYSPNCEASSWRIVPLL